MFKF
jgi:hypothetical protein